MADRDQALERLHAEYEGGPETFLTRLRNDRVWDEEAFVRLTQTMRDCCALLQHEDVIHKWVAEMFWFAPWFVRNWTSHEAWKDTLATAPEYYQSCYRELDDLAWRFFMGEA